MKKRKVRGEIQRRGTAYTTERTHIVNGGRCKAKRRAQRVRDHVQGSAKSSIQKESAGLTRSTANGLHDLERQLVVRGRATVLDAEEGQLLVLLVRAQTRLLGATKSRFGSNEGTMTSAPHHCTPSRMKRRTNRSQPSYHSSGRSRSHRG